MQFTRISQKRYNDKLPKSCPVAHYLGYDVVIILHPKSRTKFIITVLKIHYKITFQEVFISVYMSNFDQCLY